MIARIRIQKRGKDKCEPQRDAYSDLEDILQLGNINNNTKKSMLFLRASIHLNEALAT